MKAKRNMKTMMKKAARKANLLGNGRRYDGFNDESKKI